jgi:SAM-dependent methyltransferase
MTAEFEGVFGDDYLHFYEASLTSELSDRQAELIARLLDLRAGQRVLDVPCGHGRITERLAVFGCDVVGVDSDPVFLERARSSAPDLDYREGDMRRLEFDAEFDAVVNWFTSFGYFDDDTDRSILRSFRRALKPGGKLLLELQNRDPIVQMVGAGSAWVEERGDDFLIDRQVYDVASGRTRTSRVMIRDGRVKRTHYSVRLFTFTELRDWLLDAGFASATAYAGDGEPFSRDSRRMVLVAET